MGHQEAVSTNALSAATIIDRHCGDTILTRLQLKSTYVPPRRYMHPLIQHAAQTMTRMM